MGQCCGKDRGKKRPKDFSLLNDQDILRYADEKILRGLDDPAEIADLNETFNEFPMKELPVRVNSHGEPLPAVINVIQDESSASLVKNTKGFRADRSQVMTGDTVEFEALDDQDLTLNENASIRYE